MSEQTEDIIDDSLEDQNKDFNLFKAYREGNLDCDVISTQRFTDKPITEATTSSSTIPRSWCRPVANPTSSSVTFGALCKQAISQTSSVNPVSVGREPIKPLEAKDKTSSKPTGGNSILVNDRQRGNPLLKHIHNVAWEFADIEPDYVVGRNHCVFFLSLRYHNLNSEYIFERIKNMKQNYQLSVLLCQVDVADPHYPLKELCKFCLAEKLTLMLAWSAEEAARYLEAYKALENKPPDGLMPETASASDLMAQVTDFLTAIRPVTKADAASVVQNFKSIADVIRTDSETLENCPGFGRRKAQKLHEVFHMPFIRETS